MRFRTFLVFAIIAILISVYKTPVSAQTLLPPSQPARSATSSPVPYLPLRYEEDWSFLQNPSHHKDIFDAIKYMPLNGRGNSYLSFGGETRERYEYYRNLNFGKGPEDTNGYFQQRYLLHLDAHLDTGIRIFTQIGLEEVNGRTGGPRPTDSDDLDWQQVFLDVKITRNNHNSLTVRAGRQEMVFGSGRLVNASEGANVRTRFDGVRLLYKTSLWHLDGFITRPTLVHPGKFEDRADYTRLFWGIYGTGPLFGLSGGNMDLYFLDLDSRSETYVQGTAAEIRRSIGTRLFGQKNSWDYNFEGVYQFGTFGAGKINAYGLDSDTGYTWRHARFTPRVGLRANIASGDHNPSDTTLQTFNPLFPSLNYYNISADAGVKNIRDLHPTIDLHLARPVFLSAGWDFFWRDSLQDGLYNPGRGVLLSGSGSNKRYNGDQPEIQFRWASDSHTMILLDYTRATPGGFLRDKNAKTLDYFTTYVTYKF